MKNALREKNAYLILTLLFISQSLSVGCSEPMTFATSADAVSFLEGTWDAQGRHESAKLIFESGQLTILGSVVDKPFECEFDLSAKPQRVKLNPHKGIGPTLLGIFEVSGNELKLSYRMHAKRELGFPDGFEDSSGGIEHIKALRSSAE